MGLPDSIYRLRQFAAALLAHVHHDERILLTGTLNAAQLALFERMPRFDQRHCLDVYHWLVRAGQHDPHLLQAALLHDCGKVDATGRTIPLIYYGVIVILQRVAPALYRRAVAYNRGLLRPFALHYGHEARGAAYAAAAGSDPAVIAILSDYAARRSTPLTEALHAADDAN